MRKLLHRLSGGLNLGALGEVLGERLKDISHTYGLVGRAVAGGIAFDPPLGGLLACPAGRA